MNKEISLFVDKYVKEIKENNAAMFIGAGLSKSAGYADWKDLLRCAAKDLDLDVEKENLVSLAQYYCNKYGNRSLLNDKIFGEFSKTKPVDENHKIIARLPIFTYWTTNYDSLIEDALNEEKKIVDVKHRNEHLSLTKPHRDAIVYKMHGDKSDPNNAILIKDDYEQYYRKHAQFIAALSDDLISKTFLFVGFSFSDPNIDYILSRIRIEYEGQNSRQHYAIMRKVKECDFNNPADYEYAQRKQDLFVEELKRHNIKALLIDEYSEITGILEEISKRLYRSNVFISGSAHEYSEYSDSETASDFIQQLSKELIAQGFNIVSGFGLGVGSSVIFGVLQEIYINQKSTLKDRLILRPFPQGIEDAATKQDLWNKYREDMISRAGVSVFLFGNKLDADTGKVILADGMEAEFDIAFKMGNLLVPVGCTGYVARELWNKISNNMSKYYTDADDDALIAAFNKLNAKSDSLVNDVISFIKLFENGKYKPVCDS